MNIQNVIGSIDDETRCKHYQSEVDRIAIKFKCCNTYFPCYECHQEHTEHEIERWNKDERHHEAIFCGACHSELTIETYLNNPSVCANCLAPFNRHCRNHHHLYFEL
ncbi:CHY zinc finger protein [Alkalibacillus almallahensis]|uniref:CHY zinc finger protein n=1 Tax=Alkalibacillus almallahensis TaxID=1379154 RepID=UPI001ABA5A58|nr:CHY zinc finger protein [Alkalibacillus almallahensis]NIK12105.1 putative CHY-type Zn-finger protein [Alkalibacillus almallahensis]